MYQSTYKGDDGFFPRAELTGQLNVGRKSTNHQSPYNELSAKELATNWVVAKLARARRITFSQRSRRSNKRLASMQENELEEGQNLISPSVSLLVI